MKNLLSIAFILFSIIAAAQQEGHIRGIVKDSSNSEVVPFASIRLIQSGKAINGKSTDLNGEFHFLKLKPGSYDVEVKYVGYQTKKLNGLSIKAGDTTFLDIQLNKSVELSTVLISNELNDVEYEVSPVSKNGKLLKAKGSRRFIGGQNNTVYNYQYDNSNEDYQELSDNRFQSPLVQPLSTFSADVDRASYANTRRYLNDGLMPPKDAVRIEELINYFDYDYPEPSGEHPFSITTEFADCPWNEYRKIAMIGLQAKRIDLSETPANNLVFLLDVSGSMNSYDKLGLLKQGMHMLVDQMREEDHISIVVYAGAAGVVLEPTSGDQKAKIKAAIDQLNAGGSTAGGEGIQLAYQLAEDNFKTDGNNRIILATDGDFNVGITNRSKLIELIEEKRESGVFLTVLGFGSGNIKDHTMEQLANKGNGNYNYIDNLLEAKKVLVKEMSATLHTVAKDVKLQAEFNPAKVSGYRLIGYLNRQLEAQDFNDDTKDAGEMGAGHSVTALYEIIPIGADEEMMTIDSLKYQKQLPVDVKANDEILTVKFRYKEPDGDTSKLLESVLRSADLTFDEATNNFKFATAVAAFAMKLRDSESVEGLDYSKIMEQARAAKGDDHEGYRAEFIKMIETAQLISRAEK